PPPRSGVGPLRLRQPGRAAAAHDAGADDRRLPLRLLGLLLRPQHAPPPPAPAAEEPPRDARHAGGEREGHRLPAAQPGGVGHDLQGDAPQDHRDRRQRALERVETEKSNARESHDGGRIIAGAPPPPTRPLSRPPPPTPQATRPRT